MPRVMPDPGDPPICIHKLPRSPWLGGSLTAGRGRSFLEPHAERSAAASMGEARVKTHRPKSEAASKPQRWHMLSKRIGTPENTRVLLDAMHSGSAPQTQEGGAVTAHCGDTCLTNGRVAATVAKSGADPRSVGGP